MNVPKAGLFRLVNTRTGQAYEKTFAREIDALAYLAYEFSGPRETHVEVVDPPPLKGEWEARGFARVKHGDQKYGDRPYLVHLDAVHQVLCDFGLHGDERVAGLLHDTVEDTDATREEIRLDFGSRVDVLVWAVSGVGRNRKERKADAFAKMRSLSGTTAPCFPLSDGTMWDGRPGVIMEDAEAAVNLKLADRIANVEHSVCFGPGHGLLGMYRSEMVEFEAALAGRGLPRMWSRLRQALSTTPQNV